MASSTRTPVHEPRRLKPRWSVRHGRLALAWGVTRPSDPPKLDKPSATEREDMDATSPEPLPLAAE